MSSQAETRSRAIGGRGDYADLAALAMQADRVGAGGNRDVIDLQPGALLLAGSGIQQDRNDRRVTSAAAGGGAFNGTLLGAGEGVGLAGLGGSGPFDADT
ncbi:hypothetical protein GCM10009733_007250 [Nonomuraea maheshkhaliensis]|uniref:Calcium-binding protein n=1 Tax=Nonomuraea maheshkhaliensis TaxID=419590 RepID=A0ABN2ES40_9ACTN